MGKEGKHRPAEKGSDQRDHDAVRMGERVDRDDRAILGNV